MSASAASLEHNGGRDTLAWCRSSRRCVGRYEPDEDTEEIIRALGQRRRLPFQTLRRSGDAPYAARQE